MPGVSASASRVLLAIAVALSVLAGGLAAGAPVMQSDTADDTRADATPLPVNTTTEGTIDAQDDADWYAVEVEDGRTLVPHLTLAGGYDQERGSGDPVERKDLNFTVYGPDGEQVASSRTGAWHAGQPAGAAVRVPRAGTYYVQVRAEYAAPAEDPVREANGSQNYTLDVRSFAWDPHEPNANRSSAAEFDGDLAASTHVFGYDDDYYATDLAAGETVTVTYRETGVVHDYVEHDVYVYGPGGDQVAHTAHEEEDGSVTFTAGESGRYAVAVAVDWDEAEAPRIRGSDGVFYDLTVDAGDDGADPTATPTATATAAPTGTATATATLTRTATAESTETATATATATRTATAESTATRTATAAPDDGEDDPSGDGGSASDDATPTDEPERFAGGQPPADKPGQPGEASPEETRPGTTTAADEPDVESTRTATGTATSGPGFGALAGLVALALLIAVVRRGA